MKTFQTYLALAAGLLLAGAANAQNHTQPGLNGPGSITTRNAAPDDPQLNNDRAGRSSDSYIEQSGSSNYSEVLQTNAGGPGNTANLVQSNRGNAGYQDQTSNTSSSNARNEAYLNQSGVRSLGVQYQAGTGNLGEIRQEADANAAYQNQQGGNNSGRITQMSNENFAQQRQIGDSNTATAMQSGARNNWSVTDQRGFNQQAKLTQQ